METNYLIHHGIKGQKWGVRRNLDKDSVMTTGRDKRDKDRNVIKKGTTFHRISTKREQIPHSDRTYLTFTEEDNDYYKEHMTDFRRMFNKNTDIFEMSYKNMRDIIYPTHEKQVDEFLKLYKDKKVQMLNEMANETVNRMDINNTYSDTYKKKIADAYKKKIKSLNKNDLKTIGYSEFIRTYSHIPVSKIYQDRLEKQGYNAIIDDNDVLYNTMDSIRPKRSIIAFKPNENFTISGSKKLSEESYKQAQKNNQRRREYEKK